MPRAPLADREYRVRTTAKVVDPCRDFSGCPARRLPSGSGLEERTSMKTWFSPIRLVKADGNFVKQRVRCLRFFNAETAYFSEIGLDGGNRLHKGPNRCSECNRVERIRARAQHGRWPWVPPRSRGRPLLVFHPG